MNVKRKRARIYLLLEEEECLAEEQEKNRLEDEEKLQ